MSALDALRACALHGVDLKFRRHGTGWPKTWQARAVASKNERADCRVVVYGDTPEEAIDALVQATEQARK